MVSYVKYERSKGRISQKRESPCRLLVMSSWPDDGALVMRLKKANEARFTMLFLMMLHPESWKDLFLFVFSFS